MWNYFSLFVCYFSENLSEPSIKMTSYKVLFVIFLILGVASVWSKPVEYEYVDGFEVYENTRSTYNAPYFACPHDCVQIGRRCRRMKYSG